MAEIVGQELGAAEGCLGRCFVCSPRKGSIPEMGKIKLIMQSYPPSKEFYVLQNTDLILLMFSICLLACKEKRNAARRCLRVAGAATRPHINFCTANTVEHKHYPGGDGGDEGGWPKTILLKHKSQREHRKHTHATQRQRTTESRSALVVVVTKLPELCSQCLWLCAFRTGFGGGRSPKSYQVNALRSRCAEQPRV